MFGLFIKIFIGLFTSMVSASNDAKCVWLSNQKCMTPTLINVHPNEYSEEIQFYYYSFAVKLDRCVGSCNTLNELSNKVSNPNKREDLNPNLFNIVQYMFNK